MALNLENQRAEEARTIAQNREARRTLNAIRKRADILVDEGRISRLKANTKIRDFAVSEGLLDEDKYPGGIPEWGKIGGEIAGSLLGYGLGGPLPFLAKAGLSGVGTGTARGLIDALERKVYPDMPHPPTEEALGKAAQVGVIDAAATAVAPPLFKLLGHAGKGAYNIAKQPFSAVGGELGKRGLDKGTILENLAAKAIFKDPEATANWLKTVEKVSDQASGIRKPIEELDQLVTPKTPIISVAGEIARGLGQVASTIPLAGKSLSEAIKKSIEAWSGWTKQILDPSELVSKMSDEEVSKIMKDSIGDTLDHSIKRYNALYDVSKKRFVDENKLVGILGKYPTTDKGRMSLNEILEPIRGLRQEIDPFPTRLVKMAEHLQDSVSIKPETLNLYDDMLLGLQREKLGPITEKLVRDLRKGLKNIRGDESVAVAKPAEKKVYSDISASQKEISDKLAAAPRIFEGKVVERSSPRELWYKAKIDPKEAEEILKDYSHTDIHKYGDQVYQKHKNRINTKVGKEYIKTGVLDIGPTDKVKKSAAEFIQASFGDKPSIERVREIKRFLSEEQFEILSRKHLVNKVDDFLKPGREGDKKFLEFYNNLFGDGPKSNEFKVTEELMKGWDGISVDDFHGLVSGFKNFPKSANSISTFIARHMTLALGTGGLGAAAALGGAMPALSGYLVMLGLGNVLKKDIYAGIAKDASEQVLSKQEQLLKGVRASIGEFFDNLKTDPGWLGAAVGPIAAGDYDQNAQQLSPNIDYSLLRKINGE